MTTAIKDPIPKSVREAEAKIATYAKDGCGSCYGRGITGWLIMGRTRGPVICKCVKAGVARQIKREIEEKESEMK